MVVTAVWSLLLLLVPQFNLLNYYFSFGVALVVPLAAGLAAAADPSDARGDAEAATRTLVLLLVPLVVVTLASFWITNCDVRAGLVHYALGPAVGALFATGAGRLLADALPRRWAIAAVALLFMALLARNLIRVYLDPPINAFNHFAGYWSGAVYDDTVAVTARWTRFRLYSASLGGVLWASALALRSLGRAGPWIAGLASLAVVAAFESRGPYDLSREDIARVLGGRLETEHFVIIYPRDGAVAERIEALALDHEFRWHQLKDALELAPTGKLISTIYASEAQKQRLIGAGATYFAKPWLGEVHLNAVEVGQSVLKHELAHVFGASIHTGWLGVPTTGGLVPQMALIEGFAVALEGARGRLTPHQWAAAMHVEDIAPPLTTIFGADGFLGTHSGKAYTLAGSFLGWLRESRGLAELRAVYASGDVEGTTGLSLEALEQEWLSFLKRDVPLTPEDRALARFQFDAPSRFHRTCALELADLEARAVSASGQGDVEESLTLRERILSFVPGDPERKYDVVDALVAAGRLADARSKAEALLSAEGAGTVLRARTRSRLADIAWLDSRPGDAGAAWSQLASEPLDEATRRRVVVAGALVNRLPGAAEAAAAERPDPPPVGALLAFERPHSRPGEAASTTRGPGVLADGHPLLDYLVTGAPSGAEALSWLASVASAHPRDAVVAYLHGRRAEGVGELQVAESALARAITEGLPRPLAYEAERLRANVAFREKRYVAAAERFQAAEELADTEGQRVELRDWQARARFFDAAQDPPQPEPSAGKISVSP